MEVPKQRGWKIVSDGSPHGTKVYDEDGREVKNIRSIQWSIRAGDRIPTATVELMFVEIEAEAPEVETPAVVFPAVRKAL